MHFYEFNIGDYAKKTQHLSNEEDLAYRRALDLYYDTEKPLDSGGLAPLSRRLRVGEEALKNVLEEFFPDGINKHADEKIAEYHAYLAKQAENGRKGGRPKNQQVKKVKEPTENPPLNTGKPTDNPVPSQPLTTKPLTKDKYIPPINGDLLADWLKVRKAKRSGELTETAFKGLQREALKAGLSAEQAVRVCCERSWQSFKAEWYAKPSPNSGRVQEARLSVAEQIMGGRNGNDRQTIELNPRAAIEGHGARLPEALAGVREPDASQVAGD